jgi:hypothetical protein
MNMSALAQWKDDGLYYHDFMEALHKCEGGCLETCPHFASIFTITKMALIYVCMIAEELINPRWITALEMYLVVSKLVPEIWESFQLQQNPLSSEECSERNTQIHDAIKTKIREDFSFQNSCPGWK